MLRQRAFHTPDALAFCFLTDGEAEQLSYTYADLMRAAARIANHLVQAGASGERVLLLLESGLDYVASFLGTLMAGAVAIPSFPPLGTRPAARLRGILSDARPQFVLTHSHLLSANRRHEWWPEGRAALIYVDTIDDVIGAATPGVTPSHLAMLQYTSGSSGNPKGVMVTHGNILANCEAIYRWLGPDQQRRGCIWLPPYHDMGLLGGVIQPLYAGFPLVFMSPMHFVQRPARWLQAMSKHRLTITGAPNFAYDYCVEQIGDSEMAGIDLSCWSEAFCGSEPISRATLERFAERFARWGFRREAHSACYGMAEATLLISGKRAHSAPRFAGFARKALREDSLASAQHGDARAQVVSCGEVAHGLEVRIVDPDTRVQCAGQVIGEIWVRGTSVADGYFEKPEATQATFKARLASGERHYMRTGDLGFLHAGELFVVGRIKDTIIIRGRNLYPQDLETCAEQAHPLLRTNGAAAFSCFGDAEEELVLVLEIDRRYRHQAIPLEDIRQNVVARLVREYDVAPTHLHVGPYGTIPRTTSGKVQRQACKEAFLKKLLPTTEETAA